MSTAPRSMAYHVPDEALADLRARLNATRLPDQAPGEPWAYGTEVSYLRDLIDYWRTGFDWRAQEAALNAFPQFMVPLHDIDVHFLHVAGKGPNPMPLLLLHGWPGSVFEFLDIIPRLTDPARLAAIRPMPLRSSRHHCPDMVCRSSLGRNASPSRTLPPASLI